MKPLSEQDHYETLEISRGAEAKEVEHAYRLARATYAEDSLAGYSVFEEGDSELLRERIEIAYRTLSDPEARRDYDQELAERERATARPVTASDPHSLATQASGPAPRALEPLDAFEDIDETEGEWDGGRLRRTRLRHGVELQEISDVTKVSPTYLRFIEEEQYEGLPAAVYVRGFVMGYAGCLGLDADRVAHSYMQRYEESRGRGRKRLFSRR